MTNRRSVLALATACALVGASASSAGWEEGVAAFQAGNYAQAIAEFQQYVEERTEEEALQKGYQMLAMSLLKGGKAKDAVPAFQKALELKPGDVGMQVMLGQAFYQSGMPRDCLTTLNRLNIGSLPKPHQIQVYQMRSASHTRLGDTRGAAADLGKVADLKGDAKSRFEYGRMLHNDAQLDAAISAYERAVSMDGGKVEWKETLVNALKIKGRSTPGSAKTAIYAKAEDVARSLVASSASYDNLLLLGEVQLGAKNYAAAASTFQQAISKKSNDWHAHFYLGQAYTALKRFSDAEGPLNTALQLASGSDEAQIWKQLGFVFEKQKKYSLSIDAYKKGNDPAGVSRVSENLRIQQENKDAEEYNKNIEELERQREKLRQQLEELPGAANDPPRR